MSVLVSKTWAAEDRAAKRKLKNIRGGPGIRVENGPDILTISFTGKRTGETIAVDESSPIITGKITGNATGDEKYTGKSFLPITADVSASTALAESDLGGLATADDCLVCNLTELDSTTTGHDVTASVNTSQYAVYFLGLHRHTNADGTKVVEAVYFWVGCA